MKSQFLPQAGFSIALLLVISANLSPTIISSETLKDNHVSISNTQSQTSRGGSARSGDDVLLASIVSAAGTSVTATATAITTATPTDTGTAIAGTATATPTPATYQPGDPIAITWPYVGQVWESAYWDQPDGAQFNELPGPGNRCSNAVNGPGGPLTAECFIPSNATPGYHTISLAEFYDYNGGTIANQHLTVYVSSIPTATSSATPTPTDTVAVTVTTTATATGTATSGPATATPTPMTYQPGDPITVSWPYVGQVWESAYWDQPDGALFNELPGPGDRCSNGVSGPGGLLTASCFIPSNATLGYHTITLAEFYNLNGGTIANQYLTVYVSSMPTATSTAPPTVTDTPTATSTAIDTATSGPVTATPTPVTYQPGDPITVSWPYVGQVWESAYWDQPDGAQFNELPGPGNRCSNAVSGSGGPLTAACFIPSNATPGYHTITLAEFYDYNGGTIANQYLTVYVSSVPTATPTTAATATATNTVTPVTARLYLLPSFAASGTFVIVAGSNFKPYEFVDLRFYCTPFACGRGSVDLGSATVSRTGYFSSIVRVPFLAPLGRHSLGALGAKGSFAWATFTVIRRRP